MDECYACLGTGIGTGGPDGPRCYVCRGSGELREGEDFYDKADRLYDEWRDRQMEKD